MLRELHIDRIYDTLIDEDELRICDETTQQIADELAAAALFLARVHPRDGRVPGKRARQDGRLDRAGRLRGGRADLLPGVFRLLGRLRAGGPSARARRASPR